MNCHNCKAPAASGAAFCNQCGATLGTADPLGATQVLQPATAPSPPPPAYVMPVPALPIGGQLRTQYSIPTSSPSFQDQREITIVIEDVSSSMLEGFDGRFAKLGSAQRAGATLILQKQRLDDLDEVGVVSFNNSGQAILAPVPIQTHKHEILEAIQSLTAGGGTDLNAGLSTARDMFDWSRQDVVRRIILLTDGNGGHPITTAEDLKSRGVVIDVIGVGPDTSDVNEKPLRKVASTINGENHYRFIHDLATLLNHHTGLANKTVIA